MELDDTRFFICIIRYHLNGLGTAVQDKIDSFRVLVYRIIPLPCERLLF